MGKNYIKYKDVDGIHLGEGATDDLGNITIAKSATSSAENFYETIAHEGFHQKFNRLGPVNMRNMFQGLKDPEEALVRDKLLDHKFNEFWKNESGNEKDQLIQILNKQTKKQTIKTLQSYGNRYRLYHMLLKNAGY